MPGVIAFDPAYAKPIAYAYRTAENEWRVGSIEFPDWHHLARVLKACALENEPQRLECVIEAGFVGKNPKTALGLAAVRGAITAFAQIRGDYRVSEVPWCIWTDAAAISGQLPQTSEQAITHARYCARLELAQHDLSASRLTADECVAVCICLWGEARPRLP